MFRLSRAAEYAVRGLLYLSARPEGDTADVAEMAKARDVPQAYLSKLMQRLVKKGFVRSFRGVDGGFMLAKGADEITLLDVVESIEGPIHLNECLIHKGYCPMDEVCPVHDVWKKAQKKFVGHLKETTLADLAKDMKVKEKKAMERKKKTA